MNSTSTSRTSLDVDGLGQVFTPRAIAEFMISLIENSGLILEPSSGAGAFIDLLQGRKWVGIEIDKSVSGPGIINSDFFDYEPSEAIATIIGNPPYVKFQDIYESTKNKLDLEMFDKRSNLYLFFIERCVRLLPVGGELIFITPRDFLKATSSRKLNNFLVESGNISHFVELGDNRIFEGATPNVAIFRFVRGSKSRKTKYLDLGKDGVAQLADPETIVWQERNFLVNDGQIVFRQDEGGHSLAEFFFVKVGAVSGADDIYADEVHGTHDFVSSQTFSSGQTRRMIYNQHVPALDIHKQRLISRKIKRFTESTWWQWGRLMYESSSDRIYVNQRTRSARPFFTHDCKNFDGAVLGLFPKNPGMPLRESIEILNDVDWHALGFVVDGRFIFSQRSLENCPLPTDTYEKLRQLLAC